MKRSLEYYRIIWLRHDLAAGLSVFLIALPLCLGIALASNAPLYSGILAGIIGGIVVPIISKSPMAVSGPAAGLTTLVSASILLLGDFSTFLLVVIVAGIFQLILGVLKLGVIAHYFPSSVIKGMLAGIGIILISSQIPVALGYNQPDFWTNGFLGLFTSTNILGNLREFSGFISLGTCMITITSLLGMFLIQHFKGKWKYSPPAPLVAVLIGTLVNYLFNTFTPQLALNSTQLVQIPQDIFSDIRLPNFAKLFSNAQVWKDGVVIGLLATIETLLSIEAIDKLDKYKRITPVNRELVAQGVGNMVCGLLGAIPITAVIVRGSANVDAGGKTRLSAITHGAFLLLAVLLIPFILNQIPYPSLAAILLVTGYNLSNPKLFKSMWKQKQKQFIPFITTIIFIMLTDLLIGVTIGLLISIYFIIQNNFKEEFKISSESVNGKIHTHIKLGSNVTFLNKTKLKETLEKIQDGSILTIDGSESSFIDYDVTELINEFRTKAEDREIELHLIKIERISIIQTIH
ncbi:MAG: SulP family inorganic anion transporter [Crocinitomicaceae bacterium]|nr:SulP family inorganic anion transporter [Crocinitomicaceae bacterium]